MTFFWFLWYEIKLDVIRNCFWKAAFDVWNNLEKVDSSPLEDEDFQTLQNFPDYAMADDDYLTSCTRTLDEMIADAMTVVNAKEEDNGQVEDDLPTPTPTVTSGLQHLSELWKVLTSLQHADEMLS